MNEIGVQVIKNQNENKMKWNKTKKTKIDKNNQNNLSVWLGEMHSWKDMSLDRF